MSATMVDLNSTEQLVTYEQYVLGAAMTSTGAYEDTASVLTGEKFYVPAHEIIWNAICAVMEQSTVDEPLRADAALVAAQLTSSGDMVHIPNNGATYLHTCFTACVTPANARFMARLVLEASTRREALTVAMRTVQNLQDPSVNVYETLAAAPRLFEEIAGETAQQPITVVGAKIDETLQIMSGDKARGVKTGLTELDDLLGGFKPGQVIVCGARPGVGKSVVAATIGKNVAETGTPVLMFSMEMLVTELNQRLLCNIASVESKKITGASELTDAEWTRIGRALEPLGQLPLHVCEETDISPDRIGALIGAFKRKNPTLGLVIIDYLQLIEGADKNSANRQEAVASISRKLKKIAMRYQIPILLLAQLNRKSEERNDKRPVKSDLRESGAVEQDADVVILLHREDEFQAESPRAGEMDLIVDKNRGGAKGTIAVAAQMHYFRVANLARASDRARESWAA